MSDCVDAKRRMGKSRKSTAIRQEDEHGGSEWYKQQDDRQPTESKVFHRRCELILSSTSSRERAIRTFARTTVYNLRPGNHSRDVRREYGNHFDRPTHRIRGYVPNKNTRQLKKNIWSWWSGRKFSLVEESLAGGDVVRKQKPENRRKRLEDDIARKRKPKISESVQTRRVVGPVAACYAISIDSYEGWTDDQLMAEVVRLAREKLEKRKLRRKVIDKIRRLPKYPMNGGLVSWKGRLVPVPSCTHLKKLSDEELLVNAKYLAGLFRYKSQNDPVALIEFPTSRPEEPSVEIRLDQKVSVYAKYKKVADRVKPVPATLPDKFRIVRRAPPDPLADLPKLPYHPPSFTPTERFSMERKETLDLNRSGFLWPDEEKLALWVLVVQQDAIAWVPEERGSFDERYFDPIIIPTVEHVPWAARNIPIPPGNYERIVEILKEKVHVGVYEPSNSSYRSKWFCVKKKGGKELRIVHDLQPMNAITIRDAGVIPFVDMHTEMLGGRACYSAFDLFVAYDQRKIAESRLDHVSHPDRNLATNQSAYGSDELSSNFTRGCKLHTAGRNSRSCSTIHGRRDSKRIALSV